MATSVQYEVRCPRCNVSFPPGTKRCMHCGGRTGPGLVAGSTSQSDGPEFVLRPSDRTGPGAFGEEEEELGDRRPGLMRSAVTVIWVLLAIAFSVIRACSEN
jgi:hypothetical protein